MNRLPLVQVEAVVKRYDAASVTALDGVSLSLNFGEVVALVGPSGCGKSTLLSLIGLLDRPDGGRIRVAGEDLAAVRNVFRYRALMVGFVFQFHHLIPTMTLKENIIAPMLSVGTDKPERQRRSKELIEQMQLTHRAGFLPSRTSGGERQRAAVARAIANNPPLVLADEPTGNLDSANSFKLAEYFREYSRTQGACVLLATHNAEIAEIADRVIGMRDGRIVSGG